MNPLPDPTPASPFSPAEVTALAHLYRGEMYRSKIWRTRLDTTTNWAVATTGIALSVAFSHAENSPLPLVLIGLLVMVFLGIEARRYRYFDIWRTRVRLLEVGLYVPILRGKGVSTDESWNRLLAHDYARLRFHISYWEAMGRRLRRNYAWIFLIQGISYLAKILVHPTPVLTLDGLWTRAAIGPLPGQAVLTIGVLFHASWLVFALATLKRQHAAGRVGKHPEGPVDPMENLDTQI